MYLSIFCAQSLHHRSLRPQALGLSGSIGSDPERRFLQETYRWEAKTGYTCWGCVEIEFTSKSSPELVRGVSVIWPIPAGIDAWICRAAAGQKIAAEHQVKIHRYPAFNGFECFEMFSWGSDRFCSFFLLPGHCAKVRHSSRFHLSWSWVSQWPQVKNTMPRIWLTRLATWTYY